MYSAYFIISPTASPAVSVKFLQTFYTSRFSVSKAVQLKQHRTRPLDTRFLISTAGNNSAFGYLSLLVIWINVTHYSKRKKKNKHHSWKQKSEKTSRYQIYSSEGIKESGNSNNKIKKQNEHFPLHTPQRYFPLLSCCFVLLWSFPAIPLHRIAKKAASSCCSFNWCEPLLLTWIYRTISL